jgi:hypothetical protein
MDTRGDNNTIFFLNYANHRKHINTIWEIRHPNHNKVSYFTKIVEVRSLHLKSMFQDPRIANIGEIMSLCPILIMR